MPPREAARLYHAACGLFSLKYVRKRERGSEEYFLEIFSQKNQEVFLEHTLKKERERGS